MSDDLAPCFQAFRLPLGAPRFVPPPGQYCEEALDSIDEPLARGRCEVEGADGDRSAIELI